MRVSRFTSAVVAALVSVHVLAAQTVINPPKNKYTTKQDVQLGREAAAEVEKQLPILRDDGVTSYVSDIGSRLVQGIPSGQRHPEFQYTFKVVNVREINAFALPGGPMYVNRGMIEAAKSEGEVAGVIAHEISHVALRHGTAQATKATPYEVGTLVGAVLGAIVGGRTGSAIAQGTQFGLGAAFLRFSREFEKQADLEGSQIMARAGYDPREMANMFKTIEQQGGSGGPQWLSDHPNPGDRYDYILKEAQSLRVENASRDSRGFETVKARLRDMPPAPTTEEATKNAGNRAPSSGSPAQRDGRHRDGRAAVNELQDIHGRRHFPHQRAEQLARGSRQQLRDVRARWRVRHAEPAEPVHARRRSRASRATRRTICRRRPTSSSSRSAQANPRLGRPSGYQPVTIGGRSGLRTRALQCVGRDRQERADSSCYTTLLQDGTLYYLIGVAPDGRVQRLRAGLPEGRRLGAVHPVVPHPSGSEVAADLQVGPAGLKARRAGLKASATNRPDLSRAWYRWHPASAGPSLSCPPAPRSRR